jgi:hypothetical protein
LSRHLLTLPKAQREIGMAGDNRGRNLKRLLFAREKATGQQIMVRWRKRGTTRTEYRVTMSALRRHCPELFPGKVDDLSRHFREYLLKIDERIAVIVADHVAEHVEPRLDELWRRDETIARQVEDGLKSLSDSLIPKRKAG